MRNVKVLRTVFHPRKLAHAAVSYSHGDQAYISFKVVGHAWWVSLFSSRVWACVERES